MTSSSPGDRASCTSPSSSSRHGRPNEVSFVPPTSSLTLSSLSSVIQRLVDLLILTPPTTSAYHHLSTALDHAITATTHAASLPSSPSICLPSRFSSVTIRTLTPILPLFPLLSSAPTKSSSDGAKDESRQLLPILYASQSSPTIQPTTATGAKKKSWAELCSSSSPSSPSPTTPRTSPLSPPCPPRSVLSGPVTLKATSRQLHLDVIASVPSTSPVKEVQSETEMAGEHRVSPPLNPLPSPITSLLPSPVLSSSLAAAADDSPTVTAEVGSSWTRSKTKRVRSAIRKLLSTIDYDKGNMLAVYQHLVDLKVLRQPLPQWAKQRIREWVKESLRETAVALTAHLPRASSPSSSSPPTPSSVSPPLTSRDDSSVVDVLQAIKPLSRASASTSAAAPSDARRAVEKKRAE